MNEEGNWDEWAKTLSSQFLSKQKPALIRSQLKEAYDIRKEEFDEINMITNPVLKKKLMDSFAEDCDAACSHLKGASLPRQRTQVILPAPWLKEDEIVAFNFHDGEKVVGVRYPFAGTFEAAYEAQAKALAKKFRENFAKKYPDMPANIVNAGPKA